MNQQLESYNSDIKFIEYVLSILSDSRTKKQATNRLYGLLQLRREQQANCLNYSEEMIKDYINQQETEKNRTKRTNPPNPLNGD